MKHIKYLIAFTLLWVISSPTMAAHFRLNRHGVYYEPSNHFLVVGVGATYYFGDLETANFFSPSQLGGMATIGYRYMFNEFVGIGVDANGGLLRGSDNKRFDFQSTIVGGDALLVVYPIPKARLFFNTGISVVYSIINKVGHATEGVDFSQYSRKQNNITPIVPLTIGYMFNVGSYCQLGIDVSYRIALMDNEKRSLDDYPFCDNNGQLVGKQSKHVDGFAYVGIAFQYAFR